MPIDLPVFWVVVLNVALWPVIQLGLAWAALRLPASWLGTPAGFSRESPEFYERWLRVKRWKDRLPDGAAWVGGKFGKGRLRSSDPVYLEAFILETWRGEICHGCAFLFVPLFFLWNPWWGDCVIVAYAVLANLPCLIAQRYNRLRLRRLLEKSAAANCCES